MIDEAFQDEAIAIKLAGLPTSVIDIENRRVLPSVEQNETVVYRGWMMTQPEYAFWYGCCIGFNMNPLTNVEQYLTAHHLPNWYPLLERWTPNTQVFPMDRPMFGRGLKQAAVPLEEFVRSMLGLGWEKFQLKDYVKSLKTAGGSAITSTEEIIPALENMEKFRGQIEGGICVREWEDFAPGTEKRYFVINGKYYGQEHSYDIRHMSILDEISKLVPSPFYSVDIATRQDAVARIVEIGDGQVSDLVGWTPERFGEVWKEAANVKEATSQSA